MIERNESQIPENLRAGLQEFIENAAPNIVGLLLTKYRYLLVRTSGNLWPSNEDFEIYSKLGQKFGELPSSHLTPLILNSAGDSVDSQGAPLDVLKIRISDYFLSHQEQVQLGGSFLNETDPEPLIGAVSIIARSKEDEAMILDQMQLKLKELREELASVAN